MITMELKEEMDSDENEVLDRLIDCFKENNSGDLKDTLQDLNDILGLLHNNAKSFIMSLEIKKDDFADVNNLCPCCGEEKEFKVAEGEEDYQCQSVGVNVCPNGCES